MIVGVLGLGLIGGSLARAYTKAGHTVYAAETDESMFCFAQLAGVVKGRLDEATIPQCDLILPAIYAALLLKQQEENSHIVRVIQKHLHFQMSFLLVYRIFYHDILLVLISLFVLRID